MSRNASTQQRSSGRSRGPWNVVFVISLVVFVISVCGLGVIGFSYFQGQQKYGHVVDTASFDTDAVSEDGDIAALSVDWDALRAVNPDTVGWVYVPNSRINYPIVQGPDNSYYLNHDFDGATGWLAEFGSVFLDASNNPNWTDVGNFVYGHHLNDGSMFADIGTIGDASRLAELRHVYVLTPGGNFKLDAFSLVHCAAVEEIVKTQFASEEEYRSYIQSMCDRSEFPIENAQPVDRINRFIAFATCDNTYESAGRNILFCAVVDTNVDLTGSIGVTDEGVSTGVEMQPERS